MGPPTFSYGRKSGHVRVLVLAHHAKGLAIGAVNRTLNTYVMNLLAYLWCFRLSYGQRDKWKEWWW